MRWFMRQDKIYLGPVTDPDLNRLMTDPLISNKAGIACMAGGSRVETYVTIPRHGFLPEMVKAIVTEEGR